jgi:hypothetical protein
MSGSQQTVIVPHSGSPGIAAGLLGCGLGILGIFTLGIGFVPLAALMQRDRLHSGRYGAEWRWHRGFDPWDNPRGRGVHRRTEPLASARGRGSSTLGEVC